MIQPDPIFRKEFAKPLDVEPRFRLQGHIQKSADICCKIRDIYFPGQEWRLCYRKVSKIFTMIKDKMREFDKSATENEFIQALSEYPMEDLKEIYGPLPTDSPKEPVAEENKVTGNGLW